MALDYRSEYQRYRRYYTSLAPIIRNPIVRAWASVSATLITVAIFLAFAIRPTFSTIIGLTREIQDKKSLSNKLSIKINSLALLQSDYRAIEKDLPLVNAALPSDPDLGQVVIWVEKIAAQTGIKPETIAISKVSYPQLSASASAAMAFPVGISLVATYDQVAAFLNMINNVPRIFAVISIDIGLGNTVASFQKDPLGRNIAQLPVRLDITGYYQK